MGVVDENSPRGAWASPVSLSGGAGFVQQGRSRAAVGILRLERLRRLIGNEF